MKSIFENYASVRSHSLSIFFPLLLLFSLIVSVHSYSQSCCSLTKKELRDLRGTNSNCPGSYRFYLTDKCLLCPPGTCRTDTRCVCPDNFLDSSTQHLGCKSSFGSTWPDSIGKEDVDFRGCVQPEKTPPESNISCCKLTNDQLTALRGWNMECPSSSRHYLNDKCIKCPSGMCRSGERCVCPENFLESSTLQLECRESFDFVWPDSIEKEDTDIRSCKSTSKSSSDGDANTATTSSPNDKSKKANSGGKSNSSLPASSVPSSSPSSSPSNNTTSNTDAKSNNSNDSSDESKIGNSNNANIKEDGGGGGLSTLELASIVTGILASIATVVGFVIQMKKRKNRVNNEL